MRKAKLIFDVTEAKTEVTIIGIDGGDEVHDITDTPIEKDFIKLIKKLSKWKTENQLQDMIVAATDK